MWERASSAERGSAGRQGLAARRRRSRRRVRIALGILLILLAAGAVYGLQQDAVRVSRIVVYGADQSFADIAAAELQGNYFGIIPRDSVLFFPASRIRAALMAEHADIAAVSIFRNSLTGISIKTNDRVPIARWCGLAPTEGVAEYCYVFDASGYVFAPLSAQTGATTTETLNSFSLYAPLEGDGLEPLRATLAQAERLPGVFDFARELVTLGSPVTRVILRGDEVDAILASGTRITYVLGDEQDAFTALVSARETLNLADGSIDYVDLRFDGKVYVKKK